MKVKLCRRVSMWLFKMKYRFIELISAEMSLHKIALALALGLVYGIIPFFCGLNICLSIATAWRLKLNHVLIQFVSNITYPVQILMFVPFLRLGTDLFSSDEVTFSSSFILVLFGEDALGAIKMLGLCNVYGLLLWLVTSLILVPIVYFVTKNMLKRLNLISKVVNC